ncbi:MAG: START domain-containing protein [Bacteroidota bacterium]|nr:START domain-containing protein [Bacteroidota bacterium]
MILYNFAETTYIKYMLRKLILFIFLLAVILLNSALAQAGSQESWSLRTDKNGVKVYTRSVKGSQMKEFKGETYVKCTLGSLANLIDDISSYPKWMYNCKSAERIKKISIREGYSYYVNSCPWPLDDRDIVIHYYMKQDPLTKEIVINMIGEKSYIPEKKNYIRVPNFRGIWQFTPEKNGLVKVTYQTYSETGGTVPSSLVNAFSVDLPYNTLLNLKNKLNNTKAGEFKSPTIISEP